MNEAGDEGREEFSLNKLATQMVRETSPAYGVAPSGLGRVRKAVENGLPAEAVKELQAELKRFGVRRPSEFVNKIVPRATLRRRKRLKKEEGEGGATCGRGHGAGRVRVGRGGEGGDVPYHSAYVA